MFNQAIIMGNLGRDPEVRQTNNGAAVANMSVATSERWRDQNGERQERTEWHRVVVFGSQADKVVEPYLRKGSSVLVRGKITTRKWQDQDGNDRYTTEIIANEIVLNGGSRGQGDDNQREEPRPESTSTDNIPF